MTRAGRATLIAATAIGIAAAGAGAGAGLYASLDPGSTTTTVVSVPASDGQPVSATTGLSINEIYKRTFESVVDITVTSGSSYSPFGGTSAQQAEGSGFVYDSKGDIVTNQHVVAGGGSIVVKLWNGKSYKATLVGTDSSTDLAVVKVDAPSSVLHPVTLGNSNKVVVGDGVLAIGSPFGLQGTLTSGIVSALHRQMDSPNRFTINDSIQTDAPINHGNSGGPLINMLGQVIGVNTQIQSDSGGSDGVGFAIPSNTVGQVVSQIVAGKTVQHAYLGISISDSTTPPGALLGSVVAGTPAANGGLEQGDVIVKLGGKAIASGDDLSSVIDSKAPGDKLTVTYVRHSKAHTITVTLGTRPS
jgi:putative serine protease PepD